MQQIQATDVKNFMSPPKKGIILDVLSEAHYEKEHIPQAVNIPVSDKNFVERTKALAGNLNTPIVVYCADKNCDASEKAAEKLEQAGFKSVFDFEGGMKEWKGQKFDTRPSEESTVYL